MSYLRKINKQIKDQYGSIDGYDKFRLVWSENLKETRRHNTNVTDDSGVFLYRAEVQKKYNYIEDRYILERYYPEQKALPDILNGDNYEIIWKFESSEGGYYEPKFEDCKFIIDSWISVKEQADSKKYNDSQAAKEQFAKEEKASIEEFERLWGNDGDKLDGKFRDGSAVMIHKPTDAAIQLFNQTKR